MFKKYFTILVLVCTFVMNAANAQNTKSANVSSERSAKNAISIELLGKGVLYSLNYSRYIVDMFALNAGLGYYSISASTAGTSSSVSILLLPITASFLYGNENHFFDAEAGMDIVFASVKTNTKDRSSSVAGNNVVPVFGLGYRYWPSDGGFYFRAMGDFLIADSLYFWPGFSFGYAF